MNQSHIVKITCSPSGDFTFDPDPVVVRRGDNVEWVCTNDYPFAVHLGWSSPFLKGRYRAPGRSKVSDRIPENAHYGDYKYFVAVFDGENIWTDDPRIIVRRP